jgi:hypothetical protein
MESFATALVTIAAGTWVGAIVFQSAVVAPAVFVNLDESAARSFLRTLFPRFFRLGLICGALMLAGLLVSGFFAGWSSTLVSLTTVTAVMLILEAISLGMVPYINSARDAGAAGAVNFARLHRASVLMTIVILLLGIAVLAMIAIAATVGM